MYPASGKSTFVHTAVAAAAVVLPLYSSALQQYARNDGVRSRYHRIPSWTFRATAVLAILIQAVTFLIYFVCLYYYENSFLFVESDRGTPPHMIHSVNIRIFRS